MIILPFNRKSLITDGLLCLVFSQPHPGKKETLPTTCLQSNAKLPVNYLWSQWKWERFQMTNEPTDGLNHEVPTRAPPFLLTVGAYMLLPKQLRGKCLQLSYRAGGDCVPSWLTKPGSSSLLPCRDCRALGSCSEPAPLRGPIHSWYSQYTYRALIIPKLSAKHSNQAILLWKPGWRRDLLIALSLFAYKTVEVRLFAKETDISCLPEECSSCLLPGCHQAEKKMRFRGWICKKKQVCD